MPTTCDVYLLREDGVIFPYSKVTEQKPAFLGKCTLEGKLLPATTKAEKKIREDLKITSIMKITPDHTRKEMMVYAAEKFDVTFGASVNKSRIFARIEEEERLLARRLEAEKEEDE